MVKKTLITGLAVLVILAGVVVGAVRLLDRALPGYRDDLVAWAAARIDQKIALDGLALGWRWSGPEMRLRSVDVYAANADRPAIHVQSVYLRFSVWDLLRGSLVPDTLVLVAPRLVIERHPGQGLRIRGLKRTGDEITLSKVADFLDPIERIEVRDGNVGYAGPKLANVLWLQDVGITLTSHEPRLRLILGARPPATWGQSFKLDVLAQGPLSAPDQLAINALVQARGLAGPRLLTLFGMGGEALQGGRGQMTLAVKWNDARLANARLQWASTAVTLPGRGDAAGPLVPAFAFRAQAHATGAGYQATLVSLRVDEKRMDSEGQAQLDPAAEHVRGQFRDIPAGFVGALAQLAFSGRLRDVAANGQFARMGFEVDRSTGLRVRVSAAFRDLQLRDARSGLSVGRFDGRASWDNGAVRVHLKSGSGALAWPRYLPTAVPIDGLQATVTWRPRGDTAVLGFEDLHLVSGATIINGSGQLQFPDHGAVQANLGLHGKTGDIAVPLSYIPQAKDLPFFKLRQWLPKAILGGEVTKATLKLRGPVDQFPFESGGGVFKVRMQGQGVGLDYKPGSGWPALHDISGTLALTGDTLEIAGKRARMLGVAVGPARVRVENVREPILTVDGHVSKTAASRLLQFLPASPLDDKFGRLAQVLDVKGLASLDLKLVIPLKPELGDLAVDGRIALHGVALDHAALPAPIRSIQGTLRFDLHGLYADDLHALFAGMPVLATLGPVPSDGVAVDATVFVDLPEDGQALSRFVPDALVARARGKSSWHVHLVVSPQGRGSELMLSSDLAQMALDLPPPLGKSYGQTVPIQVVVAADRSRVQVDYGDRVALNLRFHGHALYAMDAIFGGVAASPPAGAGLWVGGHIAVIEVPAWLQLQADFSSPGNQGLDLRGANLEAGAVRMDGQRIPALSVVLHPWRGRGWEARFSGQGAAGTLRWIRRPGRRPLLWSRLDHLAVVSGETSGRGHAQPESDDVMDPATLPALDVQIQTLRVEGRGLGRLEVLAAPLTGGLQLKKLTLQGNDMSLEAQGRWLLVDGKSSARLTASLRGSGLGDLLVALGYEPNIRAHRAKFETKLSFAPRAGGLQPGALNGSLHLHLENGTLVPVNPGAARVLGLLNFYALPRRLLFDFRDVLGKGLAFDSLTADFRIEDGVAHTENLRIDTPAAVIRIDGSIALAKRTYNQQVTINPKISSAAAIAGAVIGGPAVGAAIFLVQKLFDQPLSDLASVTYRVTGSWENPQVEPLTSETK